MHLYTVVSLFLVTTLVGVEFSVSAFVNPAAWRLEAEAQRGLLSRLALVLGKVMPVWYPLTTALLVGETWLRWHTPARASLLAASLLWALTSVASIVFLVPLNNRVAAGSEGWREAHHLWDGRHRIRIAALAVAAALFLAAVVS